VLRQAGAAPLDLPHFYDAGPRHPEIATRIHSSQAMTPPSGDNRNSGISPIGHFGRNGKRFFSCNKWPALRRCPVQLALGVRVMPEPRLIGGGKQRQHFAPAFWLPTGMDLDIIGSDRTGDFWEA
jgi:hypothetical protein